MSAHRAYDEGVERALRAAEAAHRGQTRKGSDAMPYVLHPIHSALALARLGEASHVIQAALLHDVVEDCAGWTVGRVEREFGVRVASIVAEVSDDTSRSWEERKAAQVERVPAMSRDAVVVKAADQLHNLRTLAWSLRDAADRKAVWERFRRGEAATLKHARSLVEALAQRLEGALRDELLDPLVEVEAVAASGTDRRSTRAADVPTSDAEGVVDTPSRGDTRGLERHVEHVVEHGTAVSNRSFERVRAGYVINDDRARLDLDVVHGFLEKSYWAERIPRAVVERSIAGSLCFGLYRVSDGRDVQVGFVRLVTDRATFAWVCDVFIVESERGRGHSKWLMDVVREHPDVQGVRRWILATRDAHGLYSQSGFTPLARPERYMERLDPEVYLRGSIPSS